MREDVQRHWHGRRGWRLGLGVAILVAILAVAAGLDRWVLRRAMLEGQVRVIDGDSLVLDGREVRLEGIDAPEGRQECIRNHVTWPCGEEARRHLIGLVGNRPVRCRGTRTDQHGRLLATCEAAGLDLNRAMVEDGFAVAFGRYQDEESRARSLRRGMWSGEFERPRDWRERNMRH